MSDILIVDTGVVYFRSASDALEDRVPTSDVVKRYLLDHYRTRKNRIPDYDALVAMASHGDNHFIGEESSKIGYMITNEDFMLFTMSV